MVSKAANPIRGRLHMYKEARGIKKGRGQTTQKGRRSSLSFIAKMNADNPCWHKISIKEIIQSYENARGSSFTRYKSNPYIHESQAIDTVKSKVSEFQ